MPRPPQEVFHQGCRSRVLSRFYRQLGSTLPYDKNATSGGPIKIKTHPKTKNRSINMHRLDFGALSYAAPLTPDKNDQDSALRALKKRLCRPLPMVEDGGIYMKDGGISPKAEAELEKLARFVDKFCADNLPVLDTLPSTAEWIASLNHPQWRKEELTRILDETGGYESGWVPTHKQRSTVNSFIKLEDYEEYKECRWINSRSDFFKVFSGPAFSALEREVYQLRYFAKHLTPAERVVKILSMSGRCFATDFTAFESHMTPTVMAALECRVYRHMLAKFPQLARNICTTIMGRNKCKTRLGVTLDLFGRRMSGDMCTSLGNGLTNILLALYIAQKKTGSYHNLDGLVEGDDGLFTLQGADLTTKDYTELGFTIKMETHANAREAGFCQMYLSESGQYLKDPRRVLRNFGWSHSCVGAGPKVRAELLRAKALSLAYGLPDCPVVRALADRALVLTRGHSARFAHDGYHMPVDEQGIPPQNTQPDTRELFFKLYGVTVEAQHELEAGLAAASDLSELMMPLWLSGSHVSDYETMASTRVEFG